MKKYGIGLSIIVFLIVGYFVTDSILFDGVKPRQINTNGIQANYFTKANVKNETTIILLGGGQWGDFWAQEFAKKGYVGLSLPYIGVEGLPKLPEAIDLGYFENAIKWLKEQPEVNPNKIVVMGASKNAELALVLASTLPEHISGVIAYAPSSVSWSNTVLPYNSDELKSSWVYKGEDIPYVPMEKFSGNDTNSIETLDYWNNGLAKIEAVEKASIKVEDINGPILLFSGKDDKVWPSTLMADKIEARLGENNFKHGFQSIKYDNSGHLISSHPDINSDYRKGTMRIKGKDYEFDYGGTKEGDAKAKAEAKIKLMAFIEAL